MPVDERALQQVAMSREEYGRLVEMLESQDVESVWTVEHVIMAKNYDPLYPYSKAGMAPRTSSTSSRNASARSPRSSSASLLLSPSITRLVPTRPVRAPS